MRYIIFDFDKTLTYEDTFIPFLIFCNKKNVVFFLKYIIFILLFILHKFGFFSNLKIKRIGVRLFLSPLNKELIEEKAERFKDSISLNNIYSEDYKTHIRSKDNKVLIVSASLKIYLKSLFPSASIIGTELKFDNSNKVVGLKNHCYKGNKIKELKERYQIDKIDIFYTDSISDIELVKISRQVYVVKGDRKIKCQTTDSFLKVIRNNRIGYVKKVKEWLNLFKLR